MDRLAPVAANRHRPPPTAAATWTRAALATADPGLSPAAAVHRAPSAGPPDVVDLRTPEVRAHVKAVPHFDDFYRTTRPQVARALALSLGDLDLATEATDEALARAYERWAAVCCYDQPAAWVYRVGHNWALSLLRRRRLGVHRFYSPDHHEGPVIGDPAVDAALAQLDVGHRSVVVCRHLLGWSVTDTAAALGIREGTVKSRLHRANTRLQETLDHLRPEGQP